MDALNLFIEILFGRIFAFTVIAAVRRRDPLMRDVALIFSGLGLVFVLDVIKRFTGQSPAVIGVAAVILFLLMPVFTLRLVADLRGVPRWLLPLSVVLLVVSTVGRGSAAQGRCRRWRRRPSSAYFARPRNRRRGVPPARGRAVAVLRGRGWSSPRSRRPRWRWRS